MRRDLPSGTVTFLFTDVEGSTRLLNALGPQAYAEKLADQRRLVREACTSQGGVEVDTQGDAFFVAFPTATGALDAARAITEGLASGPFQLRIGLHSGTPLLTEEGYVGPDVHRAARIAAAGHGGQVLVSSSTAGLVDLELRDLGEHRFRDLAAPERVYQLGDGDFPPLKSLYRTNLPVPATPFVGRAREVGEVVELLRREDVRLLTLAGPGGTGKTRLALQAAAEAAEGFPDGIAWVPLAPLRDPALVLASVAQALPVKEEAGRPLAETLAGTLAGGQALLLLDNAEHLLPGLVAELAPLREFAGVTLLVTSRERLQLQGERVYGVPPLIEEDAVHLFLARTAGLDVRLERSPAVVELCRRLDQLPLALELAAARTPLFSPEQLLERLGQRLDLLKGGRDVDPRQQTLRATIEWSHGLLSPAEQTLLRRLAVFAAGCTYEAAETVCGADPDTLQSLLDKSLLRRRATDLGPRYWMLETIREFAGEHLQDAGEAEEKRRSFATWFVTFAEAMVEPSRPVQFVELEAERANLRVALGWLRDAGEAGLELRLAAALSRFWRVRGPLAEGCDALERALARSPVGAPARAAALAGLADLMTLQGEAEQGIELAEEAVACARTEGDLAVAAAALHLLGNAALSAGDLASAVSHYEESAAEARRLGLSRQLAATLVNLGKVAIETGGSGIAMARLGEGLALAEELGDRQRVSAARLFLAQLALLEGRTQDAEELFSSALKLARELGLANYQAHALAMLPSLVAARGEHASALRLLAAADAALEELGIAPFSEETAERRLRDRAMAAARAALSPERFERAYAEGRETPLDEAVAYALGEADA